VDVAIGQDQRREPIRKKGGEDLGDSAAAVVADQIDPFDTERIDDFGDHARLGGKRDVLQHERLTAEIVAGSVLLPSKRSVINAPRDLFDRRICALDPAI
jgi:hypothetical protein